MPYAWTCYPELQAGGMVLTAPSGVAYGMAHVGSLPGAVEGAASTLKLRFSTSTLPSLPG
eukprot:11483867-Alexandrium_andersonii.AAC.1